MAGGPQEPAPGRFGLLARVLATADAEAEMVAADPVLREAVEAEQRVGHQITDIGRTTAVVIIALLLPFLNSGWPVLYYEALLGLFWLSGRLRLRFARVGRSRAELAFILFDILLLIFIATVPNPFEAADAPAGFGLRFNTFLYFFMLLAFATLTYSWRTVWRIGVTAAGLWLAAVLVVDLWGQGIPFVTDEARRIADALGDPGFAAFIDLNDVQWSQRVQEAVILVIVAAILTLKGWRSNQLLFRQARAAAERANLTRYFAPTMVDRLASRPGDSFAPQSQDVAVMFVDLVGFTAMAERLSEAEVLALLRRYYAAIEDAVFAHGGTLDKYLGDGVMATFGTPDAGPADAGNALRAARAIVAAVDAMGAGLRVSVGVHFGRVTVGDVGPPRRLEFAVIGDTVNVAARLESASRTLSARIVISEALAVRALAEGMDARILDGFETEPMLALRGRNGGVDARVWRGAAIS